MNNKRKIISLLLAAVFLQYFASTTFFVHTHKLPTRTIVHSHPFPSKEHSHTDNQVLCLDLLSQAIYVTTPQLEAPGFTACIVRTVGGWWSDVCGQQQDVCDIRLRAPPVC